MQKSICDIIFFQNFVIGNDTIIYSESSQISSFFPVTKRSIVPIEPEGKNCLKKRHVSIYLIVPPPPSAKPCIMCCFLNKCP